VEARVVTRNFGGQPSPIHSNLTQDIRGLLTHLENDLRWLHRNKTPAFARTIEEMQQVVSDIRASMPTLEG